MVVAGLTLWDHPADLFVPVCVVVVMMDGTIQSTCDTRLINDWLTPSGQGVAMGKHGLITQYAYL